MSNKHERASGQHVNADLVIADSGDERLSHAEEEALAREIVTAVEGDVVIEGEQPSGILASVKQSASALGENLLDSAGSLGQTVKDSAGALGEKAGAAIGSFHLSERMSDVKGKVKNLAGGAQQQIGKVSGTVSEHPLTAAGIAFLLGAVVGLMLPASRYERRFLGETRDTLVASAKAAAGAALASTVGQQASDVVESVIGSEG